MKWLFLLGFWLFYYNHAFSQKSAAATTIQPLNIAMTKEMPIAWFGSGRYMGWGTVQILKTKQPDNQDLIPHINSLDEFLKKAILQKKLILYSDSLCTKPLKEQDYQKLQERTKIENCFEKMRQGGKWLTEDFPRATAIYHTLQYDSLKAQFLVSPYALGFYYYETVSDSSECGFSSNESASKVFWLPISKTDIDLKNTPNITFAKRLFYDYNTATKYAFTWYQQVYKMTYRGVDTMMTNAASNNKMPLQECLEHQAKTLSTSADSFIIYADFWKHKTLSYKQKYNLTEKWIPGEVYEEEQLDGSIKVTETEGYFVPLKFNSMDLGIGLDFYWDHEAGKLWVRQHAQGLQRLIYDDSWNFLKTEPWYYIFTID